MQVQPEMCMKTKDWWNLGTRDGRQGAVILAPDSCLLTTALQEMKVHPAMLMITNNGKINCGVSI
jgi:hypothetical protein